MTSETDAQDNLGHHFLVASPYLEDPRFHGTVVYICEHSEQGALGLTVNRPLDIHLGEILEQLDMEGGELDLPVFSGGPVQPERGFVLHKPDSNWQHTVLTSPDLALTTSRDILMAIGADEGPEQFLVCLGYAGWSEGQLEEELGSNAWLTCPANTDILFRTPWEERYKAVLQLIGIAPPPPSKSVRRA